MSVSRIGRTGDRHGPSCRSAHRPQWIGVLRPLARAVRRRPGGLRRSTAPAPGRSDLGLRTLGRGTPVWNRVSCCSASCPPGGGDQRLRIPGPLFLTGVANGMLIALIAIGYTLVYGIIEMINFAHGDVFMLGTFLSLTVIQVANLRAPGRNQMPGPELYLALLGVLVLVMVAMVAQRADRAPGLPAPAPGAPPGPPHLGHRGLVHPDQHQASCGRGARRTSPTSSPGWTSSTGSSSSTPPSSSPPRTLIRDRRHRAPRPGPAASSGAPGRARRCGPPPRTARRPS